MIFDRAVDTGYLGRAGRSVAVDRRQTLFLVLLTCVPFAVGAVVADKPSLLRPLVVVIGCAVWSAVRRSNTWWDLLVLVVAGLYLLDYGFANVGVPGPMPLPIVDLVGALLIARIATTQGFRWPSSAPFVLAAAFVGLTIVKLSVDFAHFRTFAVRDATLGFELVYLFIGYWAVKQYGLHRLIRVLSIVFLVGLVYVSFYPIRSSIEAASPLVGLQHPVPLIGTYTGAGLVTTAAFFFFAFVRPFGRRSYLLAAAALPLLAMLQSRGLYVAIPGAIVLVSTLGRRSTGAQVRRGLAWTLLVGIVVLVVFFPFAPKGRLGQVSPSFALAQIQTLSGHEGPSSGTIDVRKQWFGSVMHRVSETNLGWAFGVGLGPDLAGGVKAKQVSTQQDAALIRKPHDDYLEMYARYGLLGLSIFVWMLALCFLRVVKGARDSDGVEGRFLWFLAAQNLVLAFIAATQPLLAFPYGTVPLFFGFGVGLALVERIRPRGSDSRAFARHGWSRA